MFRFLTGAPKTHFRNLTRAALRPATQLLYSAQALSVPESLLLRFWGKTLNRLAPPASLLTGLFFLWFGLVFQLQAQPSEYFPFHLTDTTQLHQLAQRQRVKAKHALEAPQGVSAAYRQDLNRYLKDASDHVFYAIRYSALPDTVVNPFVQQIYQKILQANPGLAPTRLVVTRNPLPNACALVDGTILFNVGLLGRLENESQVAAVICHELSHIQGRHFEKGIIGRLNALHDKRFRKEMKAIVREEYNAQHKLRQLVMGLALNDLYHNRNQEKQADSLGYALLARTGYEVAQMHALLQLLDRVDEPLLKDGPDLTRHFGCPGSTVNFTRPPVKNASIFQVKKEQHELEKSDTLKTHPDCSKRMAFIDQLMNGQVAGIAQAPSARFARVRAVSRLEAVQSWFDLEYYDYALFDALQLLQEQPGSSYLRSMVLLSLFELRHYQQIHEHSQVVSNISEYNSETFNRFLRTLHGLQLADFRDMAACFRQRTTASAPGNEYGAASRYAEMVLADNHTEAGNLKKEYLLQYKHGRFRNLVAPPPARRPR